MANPTGLILAGGQASRMGGIDKGLTTVDSKPLVAHVIERLLPQVPRLLISANRNVDVYGQWGYPVIEDTIAGNPGPLAGILSALEYLRQLNSVAGDTPLHLLITPVDVPRLPLDLYKRLSNALFSTTSIAVAHDGHRLQSLVALLAISNQDQLDHYIDSLNNTLQRGQRKVETWIKEQPYVAVDFSDQSDCFVNVNRPADIDRLITPDTSRRDDGC